MVSRASKSKPRPKVKVDPAHIARFALPGQQRSAVTPPTAPGLAQTLSVPEKQYSPNPVLVHGLSPGQYANQRLMVTMALARLRSMYGVKPSGEPQ